MIRAYPSQASVWPGATLVLHVSTDSRRFRVAFHHWADGPTLLLRSGWLPGADAAPGAPDQDWDWPAYGFAIPAGWPSGVVIADLEEEGRKRAFDLGRGDGAALFVVRGQGRELLYKLPLATYHAYNCSGGGCFYANPPRSIAPPGARVSLRRPGGGIGGAVWGAPDHYDAASPRQSFAHWDARFIRWLARAGYAADVCTDLDIHADPGLLRGRRLLVSSGHDEYWSEATRDAVEDFAADGGNLAFFGANLCWWRIHLVAGGAAMVCHQGGPQGARDHWWPASGAARPEDSLGGVSYRHGGGWWDGPRTTDGYLVQQPGHWLFRGTGLARGDALGRDTWPPLVGYECDGAPLAGQDASEAPGAPDMPDAPCATGASGASGALGMPGTPGALGALGTPDTPGVPDAPGAHDASGMPAAPAFRHGARLAARAVAGGTPPGYQVLAAAPLGPGWQELPPREGQAAGAGLHAATLGVFRKPGKDRNGSPGGTVFSAGTTDWAQVLGTGRDRRVEQITRNVLDTLLRC
jgi:hypothetical protein